MPSYPALPFCCALLQVDPKVYIFYKHKHSSLVRLGRSCGYGLSARRSISPSGQLSTLDFNAYLIQTTYALYLAHFSWPALLSEINVGVSCLFTLLFIFFEFFGFKNQVKKKLVNIMISSNNLRVGCAFIFCLKIFYKVFPSRLFRDKKNC